jgi:sugar phosphate isomerase/epimerase
MKIRRRVFLASAASAIAARPIPGATRLPADREFTMDLVPGMVGIGMPFPELIEAASAAGFESIAPDAGYLAMLEDDGMAALKESMAARGLAFGAAGLPVDFRRDDVTFREGMDTLPAFAETLERAGVTRVGTWLNPRHDELTYRANFDRHVDRLGAVADVLGDRGIRFGLEYVGPKTLWSSARYPFIHTMAEARELIDAIGRDNVGLVLDSWHWYTAEESADDILALSNDDVVACDLNDAPAGIPVDEQIDNRRELPASTGVIDVAAFLDALVAIGYDGPIRAEPFNAEVNALDDEEAIAVVSRSLRRAFDQIGT